MKKTEQSKGLSAVHLTMMALGTVIGGSFFLGTSVAIRAAGPGVLLAYLACGALMYVILLALSEMTVQNPGSGSFRLFAAQAFGQGTGFVVGWVYFVGLILAMSSEATAVSILLRAFFPRVPLFLTGALIITAVTLLNLLGARALGGLESGLASVKLFAVAVFIVLAFLLAAGALPGRSAVGLRAVLAEPVMPGGLAGLGGSMLIVMFAYAGFEIIGLAACEARDAAVTVPRAARATVLTLVGLYVLSAAGLLLLIPTARLTADASPFVSALDAHGFSWAGGALNVVLISAILSTMLASVFGLGRVFRSLAADRFAPRFLRDSGEVPYRGILFSGVSMLLGLCAGALFPSAYLFLVSSAGFALLFTYAVILATHIRLRMRAKERGFPFASLAALLALVLILACMPFVPGQGTGLAAGILMVGLFSGVYLLMKALRARPRGGGLRRDRRFRHAYRLKARYLTETAREHGSQRK